MSTTHTPIPWAFHEYANPTGVGKTCGYYIDSAGGDIADVVGIPGDGGAGRHNAEFIVRAVNAHAELLAACEAVNMTHIPGDISTGHVLIPISVLNEARAAIARANGKDNANV